MRGWNADWVGTGTVIGNYMREFLLRSECVSRSWLVEPTAVGRLPRRGFLSDRYALGESFLFEGFGFPAGAGSFQ